ncbi:hypothetical protein HDV62DRAFT_212957 [Trichoderma sp. SZMC 28011]
MFILFIFRRRKGGLNCSDGFGREGSICGLFLVVLVLLFFNLVYKALRREMRCILFFVSPSFYMDFVDVYVIVVFFDEIRFVQLYLYA